jgi:hypothetical protein
MGNKGSKGKSTRPPVKSESRNYGKPASSTRDAGKSAPPAPSSVAQPPPAPAGPAAELKKTETTSATESPETTSNGNECKWQ